ncbi:MAG: cell division protein FtsA [Bacteroidetes bacterium]|uniref:Cell division protein FtsA n=1 Tax=Phaeocystidibacter marisrubri TaxID=1577780 RepID=A0A6L3ZFZ3_9FLAO|nr:cell division protein FtsA [Phaeocystidibacter marisrubri]KAB2816831.1 cell division protein FtsA [Phaeocystidibacter marisrubri]TNE29689.1 MAG: cell division protein FtsA [Bacteroidota bacterium]GGH77965.1 cell division protein FtsA [Phaeocystidibacter marisrubri]
MEGKRIAVGLDIGTTKIVVVVGQMNEHGKIEVLGIGKAKSLGVQRGVVTNIVQTIESIEKAVAMAEESSGLKIRSVVVGIAGQHIRSLQHSDYITREDAESVIENYDIDRLIENVHKLVMMPGEEIIHVLPQEYKVDGQPEINEPRGMYGGRLEANFHIVVGQISSIKNIGRCVKNTGLELANITLEPLASAEAVLSQEEKEAGVVLVDIGGGTTDIAIFKDGIIRHTAVIPYGGNIITSDIKEGCSIIEKQAELLKIKFGSAWPGENKENEIVSIPGLRGREPKEISLKMLSKIIHARCVEIIESVFQEIKNYGYDEQRKKLIAGIVLTGGGSQLRHVKQLVEYITGMDTRIGFPNEHLASGGDEELSSPQYATGIGLLMKGLTSSEIDIMAMEPGADPEAIKAAVEAARDQAIIEAAEEAENTEEDEETTETTNEAEEAPTTPAKPRKGVFESWVEKFKQFLDNDV